MDENSASEKRTHIFYYVVILGPIIETLLFQALPFSIARLLKLNIWFTLLLMTSPFALLHYPNGLIGIVNAFLGGLIYSTSFIVWEKNSYKVALCIVMAIHGLHNLEVTGLGYGLMYVLERLN
ncbi:CPBP family intramembrane glutamic endopeptidase [Undibacterium sp. Di27W]|uniref:CPBP family intramembrane glutamic endopeptidase n=1 Tax=Undibacterium sp. Di27W TaxID=3413036 RepID=UPI003BF18775